MGRSLKYHIVEEADFLLIKVSGGTKKNEALLAKRMLSHYLKQKGIRVILDLKELEMAEPITLLGVLNGIRTQVSLLRGGLKLCSLNPEILSYFRANRLDQIFEIYEDEGEAKGSEWRNYGKR